MTRCLRIDYNVSLRPGDEEHISIISDDLIITKAQAAAIVTLLTGVAVAARTIYITEVTI